MAELACCNALITHTPEFCIHTDSVAWYSASILVCTIYTECVGLGWMSDQVLVLECSVRFGEVVAPEPITATKREED